MSLNIKNEHVHDLVRQAAERTGLSQTSVVERAISELLAGLDRDAIARRERVAVIVAEMRAQLSEADRAALSSDSLYDETGLPA